MKKRKNKLLKLLKLGILFFGMILAFNNCQKEENYIVETPSPINLEKAKKMFAAQFNKEIFPNLNSSPIWQEAKADYDNEGYFYYEIPFHLLNKKDINMSTSVSFDRLIVQEKEGALKFKIIHFFNINIKSNPVNYQNLSHKELLNFSGFITEYDINKNIVAINYYKNGEDTYQKVKVSNKKKDNLLSKANENSEEFSETYCNRWCVTYRGQDGSIEYGNCTDWVCHTSYYYLDEGSNSNNNGGNGDGNNTSYTSTNKECAEGYALNYDGKCVAIPEIINELTDKADCVYEKLESSSTDFKDMIKKFDGDFPVSHLKLIMEDLGNTRAETRAPDGAGSSPDYVITIALNNNSNIHGVGYRPNLMTAKTIAHEVIHAEMFRKLLSVLDNGGNLAGVTRQDVLNKSGDFPGIYDYFRRHKNWQHQQMANHYRENIADILQSFDNNQHSRQFYMDASWEGLIKSNISAWTSQTQLEKDRVKKVITDYIEANKNQNCQ